MPSPSTAHPSANPVSSLAAAHNFLDNLHYFLHSLLRPYLLHNLNGITAILDVALPGTLAAVEATAMTLAVVATIAAATLVAVEPVMAMTSATLAAAPARTFA